MKAQDLRLFPFIAIVFLILTSCGNSDSEDSEDSVKFSDVTVDSHHTYSYTNKGDNIYEISDGEEKTETSTTKDGKITQDIDESWEEPDYSAGDYDKIEIIKINDNGLTLLFKSYTNEFKLKQNWIYETSFIEGSKEDFLNGELVKLKFLQSDINKLNKAVNKAYMSIIGETGIDTEKSTIDNNSSITNFLISKDKIIYEGEGTASMITWIDKALLEAPKNE